MNREFVYKSDKISTTSTTSVQYGISGNITGSLNEKPSLQAPYTAASSSSAIRGFENNMPELNGTYRARNSAIYDNNDNSMHTPPVGLPRTAYGHNEKKNKKARVDFDEYW